MTVCLVFDCDLPVEDAHVCSGCGRRLELALADVPALVAELDVTLAKQGATGTRVGPRGTEKPLPFDLQASALSSSLRSTMVGWVLLVSEERYAGARELPGDRVSAMAGWLLAEVEWLRHHEAAAEAVTEVLTTVAAVRQMVDSPASRVFVGVCSSVHGGVECTEYLYARRSASEVKCRVCGVVHSVDERVAVLKAAVAEVLATPSEIAQAGMWVGESVRRDQISRWVQAKRLMAKGHRVERGEERPLYRIGDVQDLLATTRKAG